MTEDETIQALLADLTRLEEQAQACDALGLVVQARRMRMQRHECRLNLTNILRSAPVP